MSAGTCRPPAMRSGSPAPPTSRPLDKMRLPGGNALTTVPLPGRTIPTVRYCLAALFVIVLAACSSSRGGPIAYDDAGTFRAPDAPQVVALESGYRIAPMDTVTVRVFRMPD